MQIDLKKILLPVISILLIASFSACSKNSSPNDMTTVNSQIENTSVQQTKSVENDDMLTAGTDEYKGFTVDNILHSKEYGDIHFHLYVPSTYDSSKAYALYLTLPGYQGLYFQGVAENLKSENFAFEAMNYNKEMIIAAPQLEDWGETSANKTIALTEYLISHYSIDKSKVYANGYSGGGETMSIVMGKRADLFAAYLHCASQWDGEYEAVVKNKVPVYFVVGESDEYYGAEPSIYAYNQLYDLYKQQGLTESEIANLLVLDIKDKAYFSNGGVQYQHAGSGLIARDKQIMGWLFNR